MSDKNSSSSSGIGFVGLLQVVFITLKLCNVIDWAWVWVLTPLWMSTIVGVAIVVICVLIARWK